MALKTEQQLIVGEWRYLPAQDKLVKLTGDGVVYETAALDNLCQKALNYFVANAGRLVTRDELLADVWGVRDVSDGRISRVIRVLRVALGDNSREPKYIETIPKRGFRFVAPIETITVTVPEVSSNIDEMVEDGELAVLADSATPSTWFSKRNLILGSAFLLSLLLLTVYVVQHQQVQPVPFAKIKPISSMAGIELYPSVSRDGRYLVYSHSVDLEHNNSLILQDLQTLEKRVLITDAEAGLFGPVLTADLGGLYYQKLSKGHYCEIRKLEFTNGVFTKYRDEFVTQCGKNSNAVKLQLTPDNRSVIFPSAEGGNNNVVLMMYSFDSKQRQQLTSPPATSYGDFTAELSNDGSYIAFIRDAMNSSGQIWLMSMKDRQSKLVYEPKSFYPSTVSWSSKPSHLLLPAGNEGIVEISLDTLQTQPLSRTDDSINEVIEISPNNYVVSYGEFWHTTLSKFSNKSAGNIEQAEKIVSSAGNDVLWLPNPIENGPTAVLSDRSGQKQLWLYYSDGRQKQISQFPTFDIASSPRFSPDGKKILVRVRNTLWLFEDDKKPLQLTETANRAYSANWGSNSDTIFYTSSSIGGQSQIVKINLVENQEQVFSSELDFYIESPSGLFSFQRRSNSAKFEIVFDGGIQDFDFITEKVPTIALTSSSIYFFKKQDNSKYELFRYIVKEKKLVSTGVTSALKSNRIHVSADEKYIYIDDASKGDIDIGMVSLTD